jgi:hypothetical protein
MHTSGYGNAGWASDEETLFDQENGATAHRLEMAPIAKRSVSRGNYFPWPPEASTSSSA